MDVDFDSPLFISDSEVFYFIIPRRFAWLDFCEVVQKHLDDFQIVSADEWKLRSVDDNIIYRKV